MSNRPLTKKGFFMLIGLVITLIIISFLLYASLNTYLGKSSFDKKTDSISSTADIDTSSNYQAIEADTRKKIDEVTQKHLNELGNIDKQLDQ